MSHGFKLRFDEMREGDPTNQQDIPQKNDQKNDENAFYLRSGHTRNVCFVWANEKHLFLNYAYLIAGEFNPNDDKNLIKLIFSSHTILLYGYNLHALYVSLLDHMPRFIFETDERYSLGGELKESIVIEIIVEKKDA
jgi:hypothetical protein